MDNKKRHFADQQKRGIRRLIFVVAVIFCSWFKSGAQPILEVNDQIIEHNFMPNELSYYLDSTNTLSFSQITADSFSNRFEQHFSYRNKDFKKNSSYWIRLPIRHSATSSKIWLLEFYDQTIDHIEMYIPQHDGSYRNLLMGDNQPFAHRTFRHKNFEVST